MFACGIVIGAAVTKTTGLLYFFLRVATLNNTGKNMSLFIHLFYYGAVRADSNDARLSTLLDCHALIFLGDFSCLADETVK